MAGAFSCGCAGHLPSPRARGMWLRDALGAHDSVDPWYSTAEAGDSALSTTTLFMRLWGCEMEIVAMKPFPIIAESRRLRVCDRFVVPSAKIRVIRIRYRDSVVRNAPSARNQLKVMNSWTATPKSMDIVLGTTAARLGCDRVRLLLPTRWRAARRRRPDAGIGCVPIPCL